MGNQVCALGSQPGEVPLLFLRWGEKTRPVYVKGRTEGGSTTTTTLPLCYKMTQRHISANRSGKDSLWPCQLKARRRGIVSVTFV